MTEAAKPTVDRLLVEVTIAAPAGDVWEAIRDQEKIRNWFGWDADTLKDEIDFIFGRYGRADGATRTLRFEGTEDRFEVAERGSGSVLRVIRAAPADESWDDIYEDMTEGWISFVQQLRLAMERHGLGPRRTIYLSGNAKEGGSGPIAALGLTSLRAHEDRHVVRVDLPTGEVVKGEVWHRTSWQIGMTVPQWGDGLLIATDKSLTDAAAHGRGMLILTTYGLSEDAFVALEARWRGWWDTHYEASAAQEGCA
ncbi:hypothetical protein RCO27_02445 [Sphingosinicella sp. LHD-64]|uniref:SRPBCC family protein n=1 Tax=Sphingosinicella sp. LHD-64 TaxID=3072139 RepID=UPI00280DDEBE|nr:hypothetical protein [Sphingosinicella sp. LHD-64]MDQ8755078.1 hypothetical protein [Sphingosinicella sp. LHD-64]